MINVRVNNLTGQYVGYFDFPQVPRRGEGVFLNHGNEYKGRLEVVDVTYRQPSNGQPLDVEVLVVARPDVP